MININDTLISLIESLKVLHLPLSWPPINCKDISEQADTASIISICKWETRGGKRSSDNNSDTMVTEIEIRKMIVSWESRGCEGWILSFLWLLKEEQGANLTLKTSSSAFHNEKDKSWFEWLGELTEHREGKMQNGIDVPCILCKLSLLLLDFFTWHQLWDVPLIIALLCHCVPNKWFLNDQEFDHFQMFKLYQVWWMSPQMFKLYQVSVNEPSRKQPLRRILDDQITLSTLSYVFIQDLHRHNGGVRLNTCCKFEQWGDRKFSMKAGL